jgi:hypothetical protein
MEPAEAAEFMGMKTPAFWTMVNRAARRNLCPSTLRLVCRYVEEYLGTGEPWPL